MLVMDALTISRALSYSVMVLSLCMKFPQISAVYSSKSTEGLNVRGYWMEIATYIIGASFGYTLDYHITTYGEAILLAIQSALIIFLGVYYGRLWNLENIALATLTVTFVGLTVIRAVPEAFLRLLLLTTLPLAIASKMTQVLELYRIKTQGDVSALMWGLAGYGCAARLVTIIVEVKDVQIFLNFLASLLLNATIVTQCLYYGNTKKMRTE